MPNSRISDLTKITSLDQNADAQALLLLARSKSHNETIGYQDFKGSITDNSVLITGDQSVAGIKTFTDDAVFEKNVSVNGHLSVKGDIFNLRFQEGVDPSTLTAWQSGVYTSGSNVEHNGKSWQSTSDTVDSDEPGVPSVKSTASITVIDFSRVTNGDSIQLIAQDGTIFDLIEGQHWTIGASNEITATNIATGIFNEASSHFTASSAANSDIVVIEQIQAGISGNTSITIVTTVDPNLISKTDFSGGTGSAVNPWQDITQKDADQFLTELDSNLDTKGSLTVGTTSLLKGALEAQGASDLKSTLSVGGATSLLDTLDVTGITNVTTLQASGATNLNNNLTVTASEARFVVDNAIFEKDVEIQGDLSVKGDVFNLRFQDAGGIDQDNFLTQLDSNLVTKGGLTVDLDSELKGALSVTGLSTLTSLDVPGASTLSSLDVSGSSTLSSLNVSGASALSSLDVSGASTLTSLDVSGNTVLSDTVINGDLTLNGNTTFIYTNLEVTQDTTLNTLTVSGLAQFDDKVGIGTANPDKSLEVAGNFRATKTAADSGALAFDLNVGGGADHPKLSLYDKNGGNEVNLLYSRLQFTRDAEVFISAKSDLKLVTNGQDRITITSDGKAGFGTTSPEELLDVRGTIKSKNDGDDSEVKLVSSGGMPYINLQRGSSAGGDWKIKAKGNGSQQTLTTSLDTSELLTIQADGNVGIGTDNPDNKLEVKTPGGKYALSVVDDTAPEQHLGGLFVHEDGATTDGLDLYLKQPGGSTKVAIKSNGDSYFNGGNVGIGDSSPECKLDVEEDSTGTVFRVGGTSAVGHEFQINSTQENPYLLLRGEGSDSKLQLHSSGFSYFRGGNVGIGTTSPTSELQVVGDTNLDSLIVQSGSRFQDLVVIDQDIVGGNIGNDFNIYTNSLTADLNLGAGNIQDLITLKAQKSTNPSTGADSGQDILFNNSNVGINVASVDLSPTNQDKFKLHVSGDVKLEGRLFATDVFETYPVIPKVGDTNQGSVVAEPAAVYSAGDKGTLIYTDNFIYICIQDSDGSDVSKVAWKRMAISAW